MRRNRVVAGFLLLLLLGGVAAPVRADEGASTGPVVRIEAEVRITPAGDGAAKIRVGFEGDAYAAAKARIPDARQFLQDMAPNRADYQLAPGASATYDDAAKSVVMAVTELGAAKNRGDGRWEIVLDPGMELEAPPERDAARPVFVFRQAGQWDSGVRFAGRMSYALPEGATGGAFDPATRLLSWDLPFHGTGDGRVGDPVLVVKDRLMTSVYKLYGFGAEFSGQWVAKTVWRNAGTNVVRNLKVRYRVERYAEWSPWDKFPELVPGETVVSVYYPLLDASIAHVRSNTPADVRFEWRWEDAAGKAHEDDGAKRIVLLGINEFVFSNLGAGESFGSWAEAFNNAPLLAAWVSRNDPVVKQFAAMANRMAGGVGATTDDASAIRVLAACYEILRANDFTYQHPPSLADRSVSFDVKAVQNVKFPRDVIRDRSGTCIDLAILYASMANAVGLDPYLALIPGHCFPFVKLPSGSVYAVEATGIGGGKSFGSADFAKAQEVGNQELAAARKDGRIFEVPIRDNWTKGVSNPELEDFPADILQRWGMKEAPLGDVPASGPAARGGVEGLVGLWGGAMSEAKLNEQLSLAAAVIGLEHDAAGAWRAGVRLEFEVKQSGAADAQVVAVGIYEGGRVDGATVRFPATKLKRTVVGQDGEGELDGNPLVVGLDERGMLVGSFEGEGGFRVTLAPKRDGATPEPAAPAAPGGEGTLAGSWGGGMNGVDIGSGVALDEMYVDVAAGPGGTATAKVRMEMHLAANGRKIRVDVDYAGGRVDGDALRFDKAAWHRTVADNGQKDDLDGSPMTLRLTPEGAMKGAFEGSGALTFTLARRAR